MHRITRCILLTILTILCASPEDKNEFLFKEICSAGGCGILLYIKWNPVNSTLSYKEHSYPDILGFSEKLLPTAKDYKIEDMGQAIELNDISALIRQLAEQASLADDNIRIFDGIIYKFEAVRFERPISITYDNPQAHKRIMDAACVGIVSKIKSFVEEFKISKGIK